jgi:hypothetical protein
MLPSKPATGTAADAARLAAQRAFFQQAMGRPAATAAPVQAAALPVRTVELRPAANAEAPAKVLRPGSLLDIRV